MALAMFIVGLLFGMALSLTMALFAILSMDGHFSANLSAAGAELRLRLTGRNRKVRAAAPVRTVEDDARVRALQDEIRIMQRLMDQARTERETHASEMAKTMEEISALRAVAGEREERLAGMEATLRDETARAGKMRDEIAGLSADLAHSRREAKDLETELSLVQSRSGMSAISEEIARLSAERDELTARLERMTRPVVVVK